MAVNNATLMETDFSPYYLIHCYHPTLYHEPPEFAGVERRMKELPRQFLTRLCDDWSHVSEIYARTKICMCKDLTNTSRHTDSTCETWYSSVQQSTPETKSDQNTLPTHRLYRMPAADQ